MKRGGRALLCVAVLATAVVPRPVAGQSEVAARALVFKFTPTARAQIAIWVESADGTFQSTVKVTQAVTVRGIGNRPGATQMNSGYHWPYGRREGVLPIWAHRRAAAPGAGQFPRVVFQNRPEGFASRTCEDSTPDAYFCLSFDRRYSSRETLDAITCASPFNSDKGRFLKPSETNYTEPAVIDGRHISRVVGPISLYPPRRDVSPCDPGSVPSPCQGGSNSCRDTVDAAKFAEAARAAMPDIDAVTMATPPAMQQSVMYSVPDAWPPGEYVAWLEINTEGDYNATFNGDTLPTPDDNSWDSWAIGTGYPYRGQPSVVYRVPFSLGDNSGTFATVAPFGYGSIDGLEPDAGEAHPMDSSISDDPATAPGSGADRLLLGPSGDRLAVEVRDQEFCRNHAPPAEPGELAVAPVADVKNAHRWGHLSFRVPASPLPIATYEVRFSTHEILPGDPVSFVQGLPALDASNKEDALMIPISGAANSPLEVDFGGLAASTHYWVAVRAVDACNQAGPHAVAELTTTRVAYTQLSGCFVATAAWGSALGPEVSAMRRARDELVPASSLFATAASIYYDAGPAAAAVLRKSDTARALVRHLLGPIGSVALARGR
jgi:hypothetical protein